MHRETVIDISREVGGNGMVERKLVPQMGRRKRLPPPHKQNKERGIEDPDNNNDNLICGADKKERASGAGDGQIGCQLLNKKMVRFEGRKK